MALAIVLTVILAALLWYGANRIASEPAAPSLDHPSMHITRVAAQARVNRAWTQFEEDFGRDPTIPELLLAMYPVEEDENAAS